MPLVFSLQKEFKLAIDVYFQNIKNEADKIFIKSISNEREGIGKAHFGINCIADFNNLIIDKFEKENWLNVTNQLEASIFNVINGLYRQAFSSLRLALELGFGSITFSVDKVSFYEWIQGKNDIRWSVITNIDSGIFSARYLNAFFPQAISIKDELQLLSSTNYRQLSEYVHGNNKTLQTHGLKLHYSNETLKFFLVKFNCVIELLLASLFIRYAQDFDRAELDKFDFLQEILGHYDCIREFLGGASNK